MKGVSYNLSFKITLQHQEVNRSLTTTISHMNSTVLIPCLGT